MTPGSLRDATDHLALVLDALVAERITAALRSERVMDDDTLLVTKVRAGDVLGCSRRTVQRLIRRGLLDEMETDYGPRVVYASCVRYVKQLQAERDAQRESVRRAVRRVR